jgi:short-subunit dehydrogenase
MFRTNGKALIANQKNSTRDAETVVITGASSGVGRATAHIFAQYGCSVGLLARGQESLDATVREVEQFGGQALAIPTDVADADQVEMAAEKVQARFGSIDIWVNNAMTTIFSPFSEISAEEYKRATEVTYLGTVYGTMTALHAMKPRDRGCIVQVGSALAYRSIPLQSAYCGAKHAIRGFTDSIRSELLHDRSGIRITMVQLPALNTPQFKMCRARLPNHPQPVPPIYQPEVAAEAIFWAAHHHRREVYVGGATVQAIIGNKFAPGLLDRYLANRGYESQQTHEPVPRNRPDNLFVPLPGDHGKHGIFDDRAEAESVQLWETTHRISLAASALAIAGVALGLWLFRG